MIFSKMALKAFTILLLITGLNFKSSQTMEINEVIRNKSIDSFSEDKFDSINGSYKNPIFPYRINYKIKDCAITFCGLSVVDCWALKSNSSYTFFLILKDSCDLINKISESYGKHESEIEVEINDRPSSPMTYSWQIEKINIILKKFRNVEKIKKYEKCSFVTIGNMDYQDIVSLPPLKSI